MRLFSRMNGAVEILGVVDPTGNHPKSIHPSRLESMDPDAVFLCDSESKEIPEGLPVWKLL